MDIFLLSLSLSLSLSLLSCLSSCPSPPPHFPPPPRYGLEYVNADPLARGEPDFATPSGVFEFVFSSIVGALPRLAEPSLLLQR